MKLIYFDESKNEKNYNHYHLGAVCIDDSVLLEVEGLMQQVALEAFGTAELSCDTEFHAAEIFHRKKNFKSWADFGKRVELLGKLADILSREDVQLIDIQINCALLHEGQLAEEIAFMFLCERANDLVCAQKSVGMLIGDRESDRLAARHATTLSSYRAQGTNFAYGRDIKNLVDSVHFTQSHLSRFLQLADAYVWIQQFRNRNHGSTDEYHKSVFAMLKQKNLSPSKYKEWPKQ
ncbi:MAG: DUF3800 domain-containing protein [Methylotenera sp.]